MTERLIDIATPDGAMPTFIVHPEAEGPAPVVVVLMDGLGFRAPLKEVARRLAANGYYAMLPDLYYRSGPQQTVERGQPRAWDRLTLLVHSLTSDRMLRDAEALLAQGRMDEAREELERVIADHPGTTPARLADEVLAEVR